jgi:hypothetical protein
VPLYRLNLHQMYMLACKGDNEAEDIKRSRLAGSIARWLDKVAEKLDGLEFYFESGNATELSAKFTIYAEQDGSPEGIEEVWSELEDWGQSGLTMSTGREQSICDIPHLTYALTC